MMKIETVPTQSDGFGLTQAQAVLDALLPGMPATEAAHLFSVPEPARNKLELIARLMLSSVGIEAQESQALPLHLLAIHAARLRLVRHLLPPASRILDLGGANAPLYRMGYPYAFDRLVMVDLPAEERHRNFKEVNLERTQSGGEVILHYGDMTELADFADSSFDLVWSGQSIEHVTLLAGERMTTQALRVLRSGGYFCLDTPNRLLTKVHAGGGFIHPDHKHEYRPDELRSLVARCGFVVEEEFGICEMPLTTRTGRFDYRDFFVGGAVTSSVDHAYIHFLKCRKP
jgi:SAM-dependent methyltransferase